MKPTKHFYFIGIDTGVNTGICIWNSITKTIEYLDSIPIHSAMKKVEYYNEHHKPLLVRVEDARQRTWFGKGKPSASKLQGVGSVKRDAKIWEDFLKDIKADFQMVHPKNNKTKLSAEVFKKITKVKSKTNEHERDAAMLVFGK